MEKKDKEVLQDDSIRLPKWHVLKDLPELYALGIAIFALLGLVAFALYLHYVRDGVLFRHVWKIIVIHLTGGALFGAVQGASIHGLTRADDIVINSCISCIVVFGFNAIFTLSCRGLLHAPGLKPMLSGVKSGARSQKKTWVKFGVPGIFAFVLFPLTGTGPVVGSVLGKLIGLGFWTNLFTVFSANLTTIVAGAFLGERFADKLGEKTLGRIVMGVILALFACALISKLIAWCQNRNATDNKNIPPADVTLPHESSDLDFLNEDEK